MAITAAEAIVRHTTRHQIELPHVAVELNQSEVPHASHHFHPVLRDRLDLHSRFRLRGKQNIQPGKRQHSLPHVRGLPGLPLALFKHATARHNRSGGSGACAIRALPDLCRGIVSGRLGHFSLDVSPYGHTLKAPARPGLSFERDLLDRASHFSEPEIDRFVMAITFRQYACFPFVRSGD